MSLHHISKSPSHIMHKPLYKTAMAFHSLRGHYNCCVINKADFIRMVDLSIPDGCVMLTVFVRVSMFLSSSSRDTDLNINTKLYKT